MMPSIVPGSGREICHIIIFYFDYADGDGVLSLAQCSARDQRTLFAHLSLSSSSSLCVYLSTAMIVVDVCLSLFSPGHFAASIRSNWQIQRTSTSNHVAMNIRKRRVVRHSLFNDKLIGDIYATKQSRVASISRANTHSHTCDCTCRCEAFNLIIYLYLFCFVLFFLFIVVVVFCRAKTFFSFRVA